MCVQDTSTAMEMNSQTFGSISPLVIGCMAMSRNFSVQMGSSSVKLFHSGFQ
ncbi:hypothetical protein D3C81_1818100 [compost metagenome]